MEHLEDGISKTISEESILNTASHSWVSKSWPLAVELLGNCWRAAGKLFEVRAPGLGTAGEKGISRMGIRKTGNLRER